LDASLQQRRVSSAPIELGYSLLKLSWPEILSVALYGSMVEERLELVEVLAWRPGGDLGDRHAGAPVA
jgi:hypothetical protein